MSDIDTLPELPNLNIPDWYGQLWESLTMTFGPNEITLDQLYAMDEAERDAAFARLEATQLQIDEICARVELQHGIDCWRHEDMEESTDLRKAVTNGMKLGFLLGQSMGLVEVEG